MDGNFGAEQPANSIRSLPESLQSLTRFNKNLTPCWVESVYRIIKDLPSTKLARHSLISSIQEEIASLNALLNQLTLERRRALNDFLDLKGNIRVLCRVRPFLSDENCGLRGTIFTLDSSNVFLRVAEAKNSQYRFDKVFHPNSTQEEVFSEVEPIIKSALDGYNVCIFAYGQTGTGKTYTMEGRPDNPGIVPRGIQALFGQALQRSCRFLFTFSMLEIYMGNLRDLLVPQRRKTRSRKAPCLSVQMDREGGVDIENLVEIKVCNFEQVRSLYEVGIHFRTTASTMANSTSSRSHCLIRITISSFGVPVRRRETNKLWMVDLGGSERLLKTQASGRRLQEGKAINLSLSALGDVIHALQGKKAHVPYRNSKLTQILRDSLGHDSKTLMLVHVSPSKDDLGDTICSLGFATRVRSIHLQSEEPTEVKAKKELSIAELEQKLKQLEGECHVIEGDIMKLNERLKQAKGTQPPSETHSDGKMQSDEENNAQSSRKCMETSTRLPGFMRPTFCSQRKAGQNYLSGSNRTIPAVQPKRASSVYAESVQYQAKGVAWRSACNSECSISTNSGMQWGESVDGETECSHVASEYEIKQVIFPEQEKSPRSPMTSSSDSCIEESEEILENTIEDNWLHLYMTKQSSKYTHRRKRVIAVPKTCGQLQTVRSL